MHGPERNLEERRRRAWSPPSWLLVGVGFGQLLAFLFLLANSRWTGASDFDNVFMAAVAWVKGLPPYRGHLLPEFSVPDGPTNEMLRAYYYAPLCGMLLAPLVFLPFPVVVLIWRFGIFGVLLFGVWRFLRVACSAIPASMRWFLLGLTALSGSVRWNLVQFQPTALIVGLLLLFACAVMEERWNLSIFLGVLVSIKMTYLLPVFAMLMFRSRYRVMATLVVLIVALNVLSLLRTGPSATLVAYLENMRAFETPGTMNRPDALDFLTPYLYDNPTSPLARFAPRGRGTGEWAAEQLQLRFILSGWGFDARAAKAISIFFGLGFLTYVATIWRRVRRTAVATDRTFEGFLFGVMMSSSLLLVYHQRYDALALLPCGFVALAAIYRRRREGAAWLVLGLTFFFSYLLAGRMLVWWHQRLIVPRGWLALVPVCGYFTLAIFLGTVALLRRHTTHLEELDVSVDSTPLSAE